MKNTRKHTSKTKSKRQKHLSRWSEVIPDSIYDAIKRLADDNQIGGNKNVRFDNYLKIAARIYYHTMTEKSEYFNSHPFSKSYWDTVIGTHHLKFIKPLIEHDIIKKEVRGDRRNYYGIATDLYTSPSTVISCGYKSDNVKHQEYCSTEKRIKERLKNRIIKHLKKVSFDSELFNLSKTNNLFGFSIDDYRVELSYLPMNFRYKTEVHYLEGISVRDLEVKTQLKKIEELEFQGLQRDTFYHKDRFIIDHPEVFLNRRKQYFLSYSSLSSAKLNSQSYGLSRDNQKTRRVFNVLTSMPSKLLPFILIENEPVVGIDVKTSQFLLLANLFNHFIENGDQIAYKFTDKRRTFIKKLYKCFETVRDENPKLEAKDSVDKFSNDVLNDDFYTQIARLLGLTQRNHAKMFCFSILFSSNKNHNTFKSKISDRYPCVIKTLELFKKGNDTKDQYKRLSINLQALESELFIDKIFNQLHREKISCFTRHDSVVVKEEGADKAKKIIEDEYHKVGFKVKVDKEDYARKRREFERVLMAPEQLDIINGDFLDDEQEEEIQLIRNMVDESGIESLNNNQLLFLLNQGSRILPASEYNHVESRVIESMNNEFPMDDESINTLTLIIDNI